MYQKEYSKIVALRQCLKEHGLDGYIIPSYDEFRNEYPPQSLQRLYWCTGFSGSNGFLIITATKLLFATDGRYLIQAKDQLTDDYMILDMYDEQFFDCLRKELKDIKLLGYDPFIESIQKLAYYKRVLSGTQICLLSVAENLIDKLHLGNVKKESEHEIKNLIKEEAGYDTEEKLAQVVKCFSQEADYLLISNLDSICWLLNIRGDDVPMSMLITGILIIHRSQQMFFFGDHDLQLHSVKCYSLAEVKSFFLKLVMQDQKIQADNQCSSWFQEMARDNLMIIEDPIIKLKAIKNYVEINNIKKAHLLDGVALCRFFCWLYNNIGGVTEVQAAERLLYFRQLSKDFINISFDTISAFGKNGAIIHYKPSKNTDTMITGENLYLLDSGGQYYFGTTDVTRTFSFGSPTEMQKKHYTLVLKGMIALSKVRFPKYTNGAQLDGIARRALWNEGLDYPHGTGHGVGYCSSVHEGPHGISKNNLVSMQVGMIVSNEPGYYIEGKYGIRIENLMLVQESDKSQFLCFETLTMVPIPINLVVKEMLSSDEIQWLDHYNSQIIKKVGDYLTNEEQKTLLAIIGDMV